MAKSPTYGEEIEDFKKYLRSDSNEDAKRPLLYPLFKKLYKENFRIESDAKGADVYIDGSLIVEAKTRDSQWLDGFYQALHYQRRYGLGYHTIMVVAHKFVAIWKVNKLPETAVIFAQTANAQDAPNVVGKVNAKKTPTPLKGEIKNAATYWLEPRDLVGDIFTGAKNLTNESYEVLKILKNLESDRQLVGTHNFINTIERMMPFFPHKIDAVHAFYTMVAYWDITSTLSSVGETDNVQVVGFRGSRSSEPISLQTRHFAAFERFVKSQYIFTNEGSGLTADYYFSRFDEVMARIDPEYVRQHGIFFTDANLSRFALWFAWRHFPGRIQDDYIVFDPAGGSGNLVSSWRGKLRHKIVSELQPDLLRTIERRMRIDPFHQETGFTIIPRTSENRGLNFLDHPAAEYISELQRELARKSLQLDKPFAFLLNPPYKNTDENKQARQNADAQYGIDESILSLTGADAGNERYLAFLGQILNMAKYQDQHLLPSDAARPIVMIFTPTSWLIPRPTYIPFRAVWDQHFRYHSGFIVTSNEFFKLDGRWPLAFTIWQYDPVADGEPIHLNTVAVQDLTRLVATDLNINWNTSDADLDAVLQTLITACPTVKLDTSKGSIKNWVGQSMYDFKRDPTQAERHSGGIYGGLPLSDPRRVNSKTYGISVSSYIGFMDDATPCRVRSDSESKLSHGIRVWFRLDSALKDANKSKCFSGPTDNRSYCAYDLPSAQVTMSWFAITKALNGRYPLWANQYDIWPPNLTDDKAGAWYALCMAFVLAENRCVVTKFEANNPVPGVPEVFVDNPLCPTNANSFWATTLDAYVQQNGTELAKGLVGAIRELYRYWNQTYCRGQWLEHVGLKEEAYFRYFGYPDFLTPYSGLVQLRKYTEIAALADMAERFERIASLTKQVRDQLQRMLVEDFNYFN